MIKSLLLLAFLILISCGDDLPTKDLVLDECHEINSMPDGLEGTYVRIVALLPNPQGEDDYNEKFEIKSFILSETDFFSYYILDDENIKWELAKLNSESKPSPTFENCGSVVYTSDKTAQLLNSGDKVYLYDKDNRLIQTISYEQSKDGEWIYFPKFVIK